jgi:light-regulated signal transduction histidine kinase (bacteriophytochrome)
MDTILASSRQMGQLIDALLALSQAGRAPLQCKPLDMGTLVQDVLHSLRADFQGRLVALDVSPLPVVEADPALLRSVVANLLANALKFTRNREEARITVTWEDQGPEWAFSIADNGVGFNPRYVSKLFGVFQRLHAAAQFEGTGVGLANVRRIIQRHGGRVWATGALDAGATFTFTLPAPGARPLP